MSPIISGIQQIGVGVANADEAWHWYRDCFGMDLPIFKDRAAATLMTRYTNHQVETRYAILAMNMQGGGGLEIWQYTSKVPQPATRPSLDDCGILAVKLKARDVQAAHRFLTKKQATTFPIITNPFGQETFFVLDPYQNLFQVVPETNWLFDTGHPLGGVCGIIVGTSSINDALKLYQDTLGYTSTQESIDSGVDLGALGSPTENLTRKLLIKKSARGLFSPLLGTTQLELIQLSNNKHPRKTFEGRNWGDLGFIHVCFDVHRMESLSTACRAAGFPFTVDSSQSFDMGQAAGQFAYCEDPDGTLIEFVETHRIPILKKLGLFLNVKHRNPIKPLPRWMFRLLMLGREKK
jgi:catechol 2,3-dioxygenase-like lactoylglutathione lyase family enzyme